MLSTTTTTGLRALASSSSPTSAATRNLMRCPYNTLCPLGLRPTMPSQTPASNILLPITATTTTITPPSIRTATTVSSPPLSSPPQQTDGKSPELDWQTFFQLRKSRRRYQVISSAMSSLGSSFAGTLALSSPLGDTMLGQVPLDPFIGFGLGVTLFAALGWLLGPVVGNGVFYWSNRQWKTEMTRKEGEFFARIRKNRVDPSASSAGNPVPDFYGEKIQSVQGYRQWLKDQRAFNKKRTTFV